VPQALIERPGPGAECAVLNDAVTTPFPVIDCCDARPGVGIVARSESTRLTAPKVSPSAGAKVDQAAKST